MFGCARTYENIPSCMGRRAQASRVCVKGACRRAHLESKIQRARSRARERGGERDNREEDQVRFHKFVRIFVCVCMFECLYAWMKVSENRECKYGWMDGWMDGKMDGYKRICM